MVNKYHKMEELRKISELMNHYDSYKTKPVLHLCVCCDRIARGFLELELYTDALIWVKQAIELKPDFKLAHNTFGCILQTPVRSLFLYFAVNKPGSFCNSLKDDNFNGSIV